MADVERTCANCGNVQASGDFCEKCGTRMPAAPVQPAAAGPAGDDETPDAVVDDADGPPDDGKLPLGDGP